MKRLIALILIMSLITAAFSGCGQIYKPTVASDKLSIVCTIFPVYDWVRQIIGSGNENIGLTLLTRNGADMHNYQPAVSDIINISVCDIFIYIGGESEAWVDDVLKEAANPEMIVINMLDILGSAAKTEEIVEGMKQNSGSASEEEYDEHIWLSLKNARFLCSSIAETLFSVDADNAGEYKRNLDTYTEKLIILDEKYQAAVDASSLKTLLFCDRFPFRYLADDYGLQYYAAFPGCSAETEASFETIIFLIGKVSELNLNAVLITESANNSIAMTVRNNTGGRARKILVLNALQSVKAVDIRNGLTYLSVMEGNLDVLKEALNNA